MEATTSLSITEKHTDCQSPQCTGTQVDMSCTSTQEHARSCTMPAIISLQDVVKQDLLKDSALVIEILHRV